MECKFCGQSVPVEDVNLETLYARCRYCQQIWTLDARTKAQTEGVPLRKPPAPSYVRIDEEGDRLVLYWRWFRWHHVPLAIFCVGWDSFVTLFLIVGLFRLPDGIFVILFITPHLAVGVGMTYYVISGFRNSTWITLDGGFLIVTHGPVYWPGNKTLPANDIEQLFVSPSNWNSPRMSVYNLWAILQGDRQVKLLESQNDMGLVLFLEHKIEEYLRLPDERVPGEYSKR